MKYCLVNGKPQHQIDIENRGLAYGDGLFTTAKIVNGHIQFLSAHITRLLMGCKTLGMVPPVQNELAKQLTTVAANYSSAVLKVIITAESGGRGYARATSNDHDLIIMVHDYPSHYDDMANTGINLGLSQQQIGLNPMLAGLKHLNRLEQVLLRAELSSRSEDDLLVTNLHNEIIEATSANVFFMIDGQLQTPDVSQSGVNGIMRQVILSQYPNTLVKSLTLNEIADAQAMFICNCVMGVMPIRRFNNRALAIEQVTVIRDSLKPTESLYD
ncbi:aminodeoxychorismate lyase [Colwellia sp. KU-HH00111]|uniref:aminodeoxychorismate lyase n=1 Tax=Colwellia sp. KU-HH00111 TaxID=3127652 RepID=UPI0031084683